MKVILKPHNPFWVTEFQKTKADLETILKGSPYQSIEHVGSTSIPGLPAKPVLDIDIIVTQEQLPAVRAALATAGYFDCGEMDVPGRFAFRQPGYGQKDAAWGHSDVLRRNTYAMIEGCSALRNHLDVKRVLLEDADLREEYGRFKLELAEREWGPSIGEYSSAKSPILTKILERAGWSEEDLAVLKANAPATELSKVA